ncbi:MAG: hypothetical protein HQL06_00025 [Nitrospirae bacterium]|nr:hypothetical protein [Nitrospirota bacterium]
MKHYAIGIGGTGAKCMEAFVHLCAAGIIDGEIFSLFIDPDSANYLLERATKAFNTYIKCKGTNVSGIDFMRARINAPDPMVWPLFDTNVQPDLSSYFQYTNMHNIRTEAAHLFDTLYTKAEKETTLERGFRGHPAIGAAIMASIAQTKNEPWGTFCDRLVQDLGSGEDIKIFIFGSVFGGTGASGLPTIARVINNLITDGGSKKSAKGTVKIGCAMLLPYFSFVSSDNDNELKAKSENFIVNTQAALKYYHQMKRMDIYDAVYLLGTETQSPVSVASTGGREQKNDPHFIELYAALAAFDFFKATNYNRSAMYRVLGREKNNRVDWEDLPDNETRSMIKSKILNLTRFAFAYLNFYYPMLGDIDKRGAFYKAPWYVDIFERCGEKLLSDKTKASLLDLKGYSEQYLSWLANIHKSARDVNVNLINCNAFSYTVDENGRTKTELLADFRREHFDDLLLPATNTPTDGLNGLWHRICETALEKDNSLNALGRFIKVLYNSCSVIKNNKPLQERASTR